MATVQEGDSVLVSFRMTLPGAEGAILEEASAEEPFRFEVGSPEAAPVLTRAVLGRAAGESFLLELGPDEAFGARSERLVQRVPARQFEALPPLETRIPLPFEGHTLSARVVATGGAHVTLDANARHAGRPMRLEGHIHEHAPSGKGN